MDGLVPLSLIAPKLRHAYRPRLASTISSVAHARNRDRGGKQLEATIQSFEGTSLPSTPGGWNEASILAQVRELTACGAQLTTTRG